MCVCEAITATMTAALPAVWSTANEATASEPLTPMNKPDKIEDKPCGDQTNDARCDSQDKLSPVGFPTGDKNHNNFPISVGAISGDLSKIDSETLYLKNNSPEDSVELSTKAATNDTKERNPVLMHVKKTSSPSPKIRNGSPSSSGDEEEYFKPLKKLRMLPATQGQQSDKDVKEGQLLDQQPVGSSSRVKSFSITDILRNSSTTPTDTLQNTENKHTPHLVPSSNSTRIVRPWDTDDEGTELDYEDEMSISSQSSSAESPRPSSSGPRIGDSMSKDGNPLDALFQMTSKTFEGLKKGINVDGSGNQLLFSAKQSSKKKRKSRTAFSNHQIFELEKRFLYQKYLSPADRDELALTLGLSNAQVITWFQNRRAKLKRDMEELKKDVHTATLLGDHTAFIKTMTQMGLLKTKPMDLFSCRK